MAINLSNSLLILMRAVFALAQHSNIALNQYTPMTPPILRMSVVHGYVLLVQIQKFELLKCDF